MHKLMDAVSYKTDCYAQVNGYSHSYKTDCYAQVDGCSHSYKTDCYAQVNGYSHSYKTDWLPVTHLFFDFVTGRVNAKTLSKQFKAAEKQAVRRNQVSISEHQDQCYYL